MDGFLARRAQQRRVETGNWYQQASLIRKHHVFAETKSKEKKKSDSSSSSSGSETDGGSKKEKKDKKKKKKGRCWSGYTPVEGKAPYSDGSCKKA